MSLKREGCIVYLQLIHVVQQRPTKHCEVIIFQLKIKSKQTNKHLEGHTTDFLPWRKDRDDFLIKKYKQEKSVLGFIEYENPPYMKSP